MPSTGYLLAGLGVMFLVTVALRAAPFVALTRLRDSAVVRYLGRTMPAGVMVVLVVYTLRDTTTELGSGLVGARRHRVGAHSCCAPAVSARSPEHRRGHGHVHAATGVAHLTSDVTVGARSPQTHALAANTRSRRSRRRSPQPQA